MLDPEIIQNIQGFSFSLAQNFIASLVVEAKKLKDDKNAAEAVSLLENHERSKPIAIQIEQRICEGFRKLGLAKEKQKLLTPLASDQVFLAALARQILQDAYSPESVVTLIGEVLPTAAEFDSELLLIAKELITAKIHGFPRHESAYQTGC